MKTSIWVVCSDAPTTIGEHSQQLLCKARNLLEDGDRIISAICISSNDNDSLRSLSGYGADEVINVDGEPDDYRQIASAVNELYDDTDRKPRLIMIPATEWGRHIAADLAVRIGAGLTADCIDVAATKVNGTYNFLFTRAAINSSVLAQIECINTTVGMCTCKKNVFSLDEQPPRDIPILQWHGRADYRRTPTYRILSTEPIRDRERNELLHTSQLVFGVGRGVKNAKDLELVEHVANKYNAAIAGTRAIVEEGLVTKECQVGQSGISISPDIYVAIGISGAMQHIVGIKNAKKIISINTDSNAPIFAYCDYCIVDDYRKILQELL